MIEKKCKICGNFFHSRKIAMHYWNIHHKKYGEYKDNEETREVPDPVGEENEKKTSEKTKSSSTTGTTEVKKQINNMEDLFAQIGIPIKHEEKEPEPVETEIQPAPVEVETKPIVKSTVPTEIQSTPIETETVQEGIVKVPETEEIPSPELWKETAHLFDGPVTNEARNTLSKLEKANPFDNGETINEWCN